MKKINLLLLTTLLSFSFIHSQTTAPVQTVKGLLKAKEKSDAAIQNEKKKLKASTWVKRADIFLDIAQFNTTGLQKGMKKLLIEKSTQTHLGKVIKKETNGNKEIITYERITLNYEAGVLQNWVETKALAENSIMQAKDAYLKAFELDKKGKIKNRDAVKLKTAVLRDLFVTEADKHFKNKDYKKAIENLKYSLELAKYPKPKTDKFSIAAITYYVGLFAQYDKDYDTAKEYYLLCIEKGYENITTENKNEIRNPYHGLAFIYSEEKNSEKELDILNKGFTKYPDSKELLFAFINYYLRVGNSEGALKSINEAIKIDPKNASLYFAKATLYDEMVKDTTDRYTDEKKNKLDEEAKVTYEKSLSIDPDYFKALFNLGAWYNNKGVTLETQAGNLPLNDNNYEPLKLKAKENFKAAIPYFEKAIKIKEDEFAMRTLFAIYRKVGMFDESKSLLEKIDNLPAKKE